MMKPSMSTLQLIKDVITTSGELIVEIQGKLKTKTKKQTPIQIGEYSFTILLEPNESKNR